MRGRILWLPFMLVVGVGVPMLEACAQADRWTAEFPVPKDELVPTGRNPYFILEPGYTLVLEGVNAQLIITVLNETKTVDGVETRVVEERETRDGRLIEVSRNYFAISRRTNDVFYFGEDVDMYRGGEVVSHTGAWLSGVGDANAGLSVAECELLPGSCPERRDGSSRDRQHERDGQDAGWGVHGLFEGGGDDAAAASDHRVQVLRPWHRDGAGRAAETRAGRGS
jgi:hypothetical protein